MNKKPVHKHFTITAEEREAFLIKNAMPANEVEGYIWFAVESTNPVGEDCPDIVYLFDDELAIAANMATAAGLNDLAKRIQEDKNGGSEVLP